MPFRSKTIGVLLGGLSSERPVSLRSGAAISAALKTQGYRVVEIDVGLDLPAKLLAEEIDVAFLALHGRYGEDGSVQGLLEMMRIPYTGSGVLSSALCMDKILTKRLLDERGFVSARWQSIDGENQSIEEFLSSFHLQFPVVVKPSREGSTIGISIVKDRQHLPVALAEALKLDRRVLVEEFVAGCEITVGVLIGKPLPIVEVVPKSGFYDFESKYTKGATEYLVPARLSAAQTDRIQKESVAIYHELGCEGVARADYIVDPSGRAYFLEINTLPGMTETSLIPKAAAAAGVSFEKLVETILNSARLKN